MNANYEYFKKNKDELLKKYENMFIVLKNCQVIGAYSSFDEAYSETIKTEELGTFLIHKCEKNPPVYYFNSNVIFG